MNREKGFTPEKLRLPFDVGIALCGRSQRDRPITSNAAGFELTPSYRQFEAGKSVTWLEKIW